MPAARCCLTLVLAPLLAAAAAAYAPDPVVMRGNADSLKAKIAAIAGRDHSERSAARTTITEDELNGYLALEAANDLPNGVVSPAVAMLGEGRSSAQAVVDLDRVRRGLGVTGMFNPLSYLRGQVPVVATGTLQSRDGTARLQFESATVAGVRVPKVVLQQIVSHYSRSKRFPSGIDLDGRFTLPAGIRQIIVDRGQAIVVQ